MEGASDEAVCPLRDVSPLSNPFSEGSLLGNVGADTARLAAQLPDPNPNPDPDPDPNPNPNPNPNPHPNPSLNPNPNPSPNQASLAADLSDTWAKIDAAAKMRSRGELKKAMEDGFGSIDKAKASITGKLTGMSAGEANPNPNPNPNPNQASITGKLTGMSAGEALSIIGLDKRFVESEIQMVSVRVRVRVRVS